jgi:hypothetical protein
MKKLFAIACALGACSSADVAASTEFPRDPYAVATSDAGLRVEVRTSPTQPPPRGTCTVLFTIADATGAPRDGLAITVVPWMPSHDHGASVVPSVAPASGGKYVVSDVDLFMPGRWELRTTITGTATDHVTPTIDVP